MLHSSGGFRAQSASSPVPVSKNHRHSLACGCIIPISGSTAASFIDVDLLLRTLVIIWSLSDPPGSPPHLQIADLITSLKSLLRCKGTCSQALGMGTWGHHWEWRVLFCLPEEPSGISSTSTQFSTFSKLASVPTHHLNCLSKRSLTSSMLLKTMGGSDLSFLLTS